MIGFHIFSFDDGQAKGGANDIVAFIKGDGDDVNKFVIENRDRLKQNIHVVGNKYVARYERCDDGMYRQISIKEIP